MNRIARWMAAPLTFACLGLGLAGCTTEEPAAPAGGAMEKDKMSGGAMEGDKMKDGMPGGAMEKDKMSGGAMEKDKMSGEAPK